MKGVTIDNLGIKSHERYAQDQLSLDPTFISEANQIPQHSEILGVSCIYSSQLEALFETHLSNTTWAAFAPPPNYFTQSNRFFSYRLSPAIYFAQYQEKEDTGQQNQEDHDEEREQEEKEERRGKEQMFETIENMLATRPTPRASLPLFEKEKTTIFNLIESIDHLNALLEHIQARKAQYQKG